MERTAKNTLTEGRVGPGLMRYALPIILSMLTTQLYSVADTMVIGLTLDADALAAAANGSSVMLIFLFVSGGIELGSSLLIGAKRPVVSDSELSSIAYNVLFIDGAAAIILTVIGLISFPAVLRLINTPEEIISQASAYGRVYLLGLPFLMNYDASRQVLIGTGNSRTPLILVIVTSAFNILMDLALTGPLGVAGAGLASALSQVLGVVLVGFSLRRGVLVGKFRLGILHRSTMKDIVRLSFPCMIQQMSAPIDSNIRQSLLGGLGVSAIAGFSCASRLLSLTTMAIGGFGQALSIFIAQNLAAGHQDRVDRGMKVSLKIHIVFIASMAAVFMVFGRYLLRLFTTDSEALEYGALLLFFEAPALLLRIAEFMREARMRGRQKMGYYTASSLSVTAVNLVMCAIIVPRAGFSGFYIAFYISGAFSIVSSGLLSKMAFRAKKEPGGEKPAGQK